MAADIAAALKDWSATASLNSPSGGTLIGTNLDDNLRQIQAVVRQSAAQNTIASAATTDLSTVNEHFLTVTGTTTISNFGTISAGLWRVLVFQSSLTLTYNATSMILPGEKSIITRAGDVAFMMSNGSGNWKCVSYQRSDYRAMAGYNLVTLGTSGAVTMDFSLGDNFLLVPTGNVTLTFSNPLPSGYVAPTMLIVEMGATPYTITWPGSVRWPGGSTPALSGASKVDLFSFFTRDGGTKWFGAVIGKGWAP